MPAVYREYKSTILYIGGFNMIKCRYPQNATFVMVHCVGGPLENNISKNVAIEY